MNEQPPLGDRYDVAGRRLFLHRDGDGGPSVVFLPGAGLVGLDFLEVQERVAAVTTSVVYDRGGTGWSDPVDLPRTATEVAGELRDLLRAADVPAPHVLVGHSVAGLYARRFAQLFPDEVAGLLLLDPGHEDLMAHLPPQAAELEARMAMDPDAMPDLTPEQVEASRAALHRLYERWPDAVREPLVEHHLAEWRTGLRETANMADVVHAELRQGGGLPDVPLIVLTAGGPNPFWARYASEEFMREALDGVQALHAAIAGSVPRGRHRVLPDASHQHLFLERPDDVVRAVRDLL
jgi:pimeloyl-ACP methyl ester carboxylesterase